MTVVDSLSQPNELDVKRLSQILSGDEGGLLGALTSLSEAADLSDEVVCERQIAATLIKGHVQKNPMVVNEDLRNAVITGMMICPVVLAETLSSLIQSILQVERTWKKIEQTLAQCINEQPHKFTILVRVCANELGDFLFSDVGVVIITKLTTFASNAKFEVRLEALRALNAIISFLTSQLDTLTSADSEDELLERSEELDEDEDPEKILTTCNGDRKVEVLEKIERCLLKGLESVTMTDLQSLIVGSEIFKCQSALWRVDTLLTGWTNRHIDRVVEEGLNHLSDYYNVYQKMVINAGEDDLAAQDHAPVQYILQFVQLLLEHPCAAVYIKLSHILYMLFLFSQLTDRQCQYMDVEQLGLVGDPYEVTLGDDLSRPCDVRPATLELMLLYIREDQELTKGRLSARQAAVEALGHLARDYKDSWKVEECVLFFAGALCEDSHSSSFTQHFVHSGGAVLGRIDTADLLLARAVATLSMRAGFVIKVYERDLVELVSRVSAILRSTRDERVRASATNCLLNLSESNTCMITIIDNDGILMICELLVTANAKDVYRRLCVRALNLMERGSIGMKARLVSLLIRTGANHEVQVTPYLDQLKGGQEEEEIITVVWTMVMDVLRNQQSEVENEPVPEEILNQIPVCLACLTSLFRRQRDKHLQMEALHIVTSPQFLEDHCMNCEDVSRLCLRALLVAQNYWIENSLVAAIQLCVNMATTWLATKVRESECQIDGEVASRTGPLIDPTLELIGETYQTVVKRCKLMGLSVNFTSSVKLALKDIAENTAIQTSWRTCAMETIIKGDDRVG